jgi:hypothetical protein
MKKLFFILGLFSLFLLTSCNTNPVEYEIPEIIKNSDWRLVNQKDKKATPEYELKKKVPLTKFVDNPTVINDSLEIRISQVTLNELSKFPKPEDLKKLIDQVLENCKGSCKNEATFKPYKIDFTFIDKKLPKEPDQTDITRAKDNWDFIKEVDYNSYTRNVEEELGRIRKGTNERLIISVDFLASNAYGTPGELWAIMSYDLKKGVLDYNGVNEH